MNETNEAAKQPRKVGTYVKRILIAVIAILLAVVIGFGILFQAELRTLATVKRMDDTSLFTMTYLGDYGFDKFLETGASNDSELIAFITKQLLKGIPVKFDLPDLGCSTFAVKSPEGDAIFGRNFDMNYSPAMLLRTAPKDGYKSISMVNLGYIGFGENKLPTDMIKSFMALAAPYTPLDGMNEKGLAVGVLLIDTDSTNQQTDKVDITTTTAIRLMLDKAATVDEALALLEQYDMHASAKSCYHFQIADATGRAVVVEYLGDEMTVIDSARATNFLLAPGDWDFGGGQDRFAILEQTMIEKNDVLTKQESMDLLESVSQKPREGKQTTTQWSCVYNQTKGTVDIAVGMDFEKPYTFSLEG